MASRFKRKAILFLFAIFCLIWFYIFTNQKFEENPLQYKLLYKNSFKKLDKPSLFTFTYVDKVTDKFCMLAATSYINGVNINLLGQDNPNGCEHPLCKDIAKNRHYYLHMLKIFFMVRMLKNADTKNANITKHNQIDDDDLVMFVDGLDVLFQANSSTIINRYLELCNKYKTNNLILFAAEQQCFPFIEHNPDKEKEKDYGYGKINGISICDAMKIPSEQDPDIYFNPYLNSGLYMGRKRDIKVLLDKFLEHQNLSDKSTHQFQSDQGIFQLLQQKYPEFQIHLDRQSKIFFPANYNKKIPLKRPLCKDGYFDNNLTPPAFVTKTGEVLDYPAILHFPGDDAGAEGACFRKFKEYVEINKKQKNLNDMHFVNWENSSKVYLADVCKNI